MKDQKALYDAHYGVHLKNDPDYSAALFQANPHHAPFLQAIFPTGEMFQPLSRFMLKASSHLKPFQDCIPSLPDVKVCAHQLPRHEVVRQALRAQDAAVLCR